jgi:hypothetical protein
LVSVTIKGWQVSIIQLTRASLKGGVFSAVFRYFCRPVGYLDYKAFLFIFSYILCFPLIYFFKALAALLNFKARYEKDLPFLYNLQLYRLLGVIVFVLPLSFSKVVVKVIIV